MTRIVKQLARISIIAISVFLISITLSRSIKLKIVLEDNNGNIKEQYVLLNKILFNDVMKYFPNSNYKEIKYIFLQEKDTIVFSSNAFNIQKYRDKDFQFAVPVNWRMSRNDSTIAFVDQYYETTKNKKVKYRWVLTKDSLATRKNTISKLISLRNEVSDINNHIYNEVFNLQQGSYSVLYSYKSEIGKSIRYISANTDYNNNVYLVKFETNELYFLIFKDIIEEMDLNTFVYNNGL